MRRFLVVFIGIVLGVGVISFLRFPYHEIDESTAIGTPGSLGCCPYNGRTRRALLHLPRKMRHAESYLVVLVTSRGAPLDSLRAAGDLELREAGRWETVDVPVVEHLEIGVGGLFFEKSPRQPERRMPAALHSRAPYLWSWEVSPQAIGKLRIHIGGTAWVSVDRDSVPLYFAVADEWVEVSRSVLGRLNAFMESGAIQFLGSTVLLGLVLYIRDWFASRRRRVAGFGR